MSPPPSQTGITLIQGNHPETLRDLLVSWMTRYPLAPLERETVLVQSNGIAQWLKLALAADPSADEPGCGIAAGLDFLLPSRFLWQAYRAVLGRAAVPETSPFDKSRLTWRLMRLLPDVMTQAVYAPLHRFLRADTDCRKRYQLAERLADLFDQYQVYRADWLAAWARGEDILIPARGAHQPLPATQQWQAALWRALLADVAHGPDVAAGASVAGRAAVHETFLEVARTHTGPRPAGLPRRIVVFGISSLPRQSLEVLAELGRWSHVLMAMHNPCEHYWADIVADKDLLRAAAAHQSRRSGMPLDVPEDALHLHAQPLLAAWGKQGRDFIALLDEYSAERPDVNFLPQFVAGEGTTLLGQLQRDILELRPLHETQEAWGPVDPTQDRSIRFHVAHSAQREVEILHDQLLAAFNADESLRPRDVIVMVPDVDAYAPHVQAVFGLLDMNDPRYIPFSLVDQSRRQADPFVNAVQTLLALPQSRVAVSDVLDLLDVPAVRARYGIADGDLAQLQAWIRGANIRWGLHAAQRASLDLPAVAESDAHHTWHFGLRRMLLGYAVGMQAEPWLDVEPYGEVGGLDAALVGPLLRLIERLEATWRLLAEPATPPVWVERLGALLADFFDTTADADAEYTRVQLEAALQDWQQHCEEAGVTEALPVTVVGEHWLAQLGTDTLSQRFFGGTVTFATLMPMRAIPFRHVCLLGMNDGEFPRLRVPMDFDLMGRDYRPGDRSRREDDRYLFLEALLSARECLHISWVGRSIHDNTERSPSVLVGQLRDHLDAGWTLRPSTGHDAPKKVSEALTVTHPLQPFATSYFPPVPADDADSSGLFTYAREWRERTGADTGLLPDDADRVLAPALREEPLTLRELADFLREPVKAFFRQRLSVGFEVPDPAAEDHEPFALDGLQRWQLQDELLQAQAQALAQGEDFVVAREAQLARMARRGELPPGGFGPATARELAAPMDDVFARYQAALARWPLAAPDEAVQLETRAPDEPVALADWLTLLRTAPEGTRGRVLLESSDLVKNGQYRRERVVRHWVTHLAAHLHGEALTTVVISKVGDVELAPLDPDEARQHLRALLLAWREGMRRPLPLATRTAFAWLHGENPDKARAEYEGGYAQPGEVQTDAYLARAYPNYAQLVGTGEFADLAQRLLKPLYLAVFAEKASGRGRSGGQA
ncbi:exodeoxyribonuclease V subunit gamma [Achromobacter sp. GG226]|uniref:exodeoxyribonuclease V subunit gamma n=1 Tax=Verticiella alkaliphila TaxID=2779529 RepID=UPI00353037F9|nr:exodeoxyribonuclease V subunit gamma [Verticiella sp. GG226]